MSLGASNCVALKDIWGSWGRCKVYYACLGAERGAGRSVVRRVEEHFTILHCKC